MPVPKSIGIVVSVMFEIDHDTYDLRTIVKALREAFKMFDKDKSGYIEAREIATVAFTLGEALTEDELLDFMKEADTDGDGRLNYNEFVKAMTSK